MPIYSSLATNEVVSDTIQTIPYLTLTRNVSILINLPVGFLYKLSNLDQVCPALPYGNILLFRVT